MSKEQTTHLYEAYKKGLDDWMFERKEIVVKPMDILGFHRRYIKEQCQKIEQLRGDLDAECRVSQMLLTGQKRLKATNAKLNLILFHRENGLAHPDLQGEIEKSKLAEKYKALKANQ